MMEHNSLGKLQKVSCFDPSFSPVRQPPAKVRYLIVGRLGFSVGDLFWKEGHDKVFVSVIHVGIELLNLVERMHGANVVHGSIDSNSFVWDDTREKWKLVNFHESRIFNSDEINSKSPNSCDSSNHAQFFSPNPWTSPWQMRRCNSAFRDDIYRLMLTLAHLIHGKEYMRFVAFLTGKDFWHWRPTSAQTLAAVYVDMKDNGRIFETISPDMRSREFLDLVKFLDVPWEYTLRGKIKPTIIGEVRDKLAELMLVVLGPYKVRTDPARGMGDLPDYGLIRKVLEDIHRIVVTNI